MPVSSLTLTTPMPLDFAPDTSRRPGFVLDQTKQLEAFISGMLPGGGTLWLSYDASATAKQASATLTFASVAAGQVVMVNGVRLYAVSGTALRSAGEFKVGVSNTADALEFVTTLKALTDTRIAGVLTASAVAAVVTITSQMPGVPGNAVVVELLGVVANSTVTYSGSSGAQTVLINGVTTYNATGASDAANATAAAAAINASVNALVAGHVVAWANAGVVTIFALYAGPRGNAITLSVTGTGATAGAARLSGGAVDQGDGAIATGTITITGGSGSYTATIDGTATPGVTWATSDANTASLLADAINKLAATFAGNMRVFAKASGTICTVTALRGGISGNAITLATTGTGAVASGARLTGGAAPTTLVLGGNAVARAGSGPTAAALGAGAGTQTAPVSVSM